MSGSEKMKQIQTQLYQSATNFLLDYVSDYIRNKVIMAGVSKAAATAEVAQATVTGTAIASSWATPAALASLATLGSNSASAITGMSAALAFAKSAIFAADGFEGWVNKPTMFVAGEGGEAEYVSITPKSKQSQEISRPITVNNDSVQMDSMVKMLMQAISSQPKYVIRTIDSVQLSRNVEEGNLKRITNG